MSSGLLCAVRFAYPDDRTVILLMACLSHGVTVRYLSLCATPLPGPRDPGGQDQHPH